MTDVTCNYYKEKGHGVKDCEKFKKKKKMPNKAKGLRRRFTLSVGLLARQITWKIDVGRAQVSVSNLSTRTPNLKTQMTTIQSQRYKSHNTNQHCPFPNRHPRTLIQNLTSQPLQYNQLVSVRQYIK